MKGGYAIMKELQKLASFQVYEHINCSGITYLETALYETAYQLYHGGMPAPNGGTTIGYAAKLLHAMEAFDFLFDSVEGLPGYDGAHLVLKNYLVGREDDAGKIIVSEKEGDVSPIYLSAVGYQQMQNINGRTVWENGRAVMENCRKFEALMIDSEYKDNQLPSGKNHKDFAEFIRKEFYRQEKIPGIKKKQEEKAKKKAEQFWAAYGFDQHEIESVADDNNNADDDDDTEVEAEEAAADNSQEAEEEVEADDPDQKYFDKMGNYCPAGLPAFLLWGPIMPEGADDTYRAKVFFIPPEQLQGVKKPGGGSSRASKKKDGRSSIRQEVSEAKAEERAAAPVADGRGYNPQQMFMAAQIAQSHHSTRVQQLSQQRQTEFAYLQNFVQRCEKREETYLEKVPAAHWRTENVEDPEWLKDKHMLRMYLVAHEERLAAEKQLQDFMARTHCEVEDGEDAATKHLAQVVEEAIAPVVKKPTLAESVSEHVRESGVPDVVVTNTAAGRNTPNTAVTATTDGRAAGPATGPMENETGAPPGDSSAAEAISPMAAAAATRGEESEDGVAV
jgi:hypothetical protein